MSTKWALYRVFRAVSKSEPSVARKYASRRSHSMAACGHGIMSTKWALYRVFRAAAQDVRWTSVLRRTKQGVDRKRAFRCAKVRIPRRSHIMAACGHGIIGNSLARLSCYYHSGESVCHACMSRHYAAFFVQ